MKREIVYELEAWNRSSNQIPLVIEGLSRSGKKHALLNFAKENFRTVFHIDFKSMHEFVEVFSGKYDPNRILDEVELFFGKDVDLEKDILLLSDIQLCPGIIDVLTTFSRMKTKFPICCSLSPGDTALRNEVIRRKEVLRLTMGPMTFKEFLAGVADTKGMRIYQNIVEEKKSVEWSHQYLMDLYKKYLVIGGMPEAVISYKEFQDFEKVKEIHKDLLNEIINDFKEIADRTNSKHLINIFMSVSKQMIDGDRKRAPKYTFKDVLPGSSARLSRITKPINWLVEQGYLHQVPISNTMDIDDVNKSFKLFLFDVGILSTMIDLDGSSFVKESSFRNFGFLLENHVICALYNCGEKPTCWRGTNAEVSFVRDFDGVFVPNDVRAEDSLKAKNLKVFYDQFAPGFVIKTTSSAILIDKKKRVINLPYYLAEFEW